jgi:hypothetical protein
LSLHPGLTRLHEPQAGGSMIEINGIRKKEMADEAGIDPTTPGLEGPTGPSQPLIT